MIHSVMLIAVDEEQNIHVLRNLYNNYKTAPSYIVSKQLKGRDKLIPVTNPGMYVLYCGDLGRMITQITGDNDILEVDLCRGMRLRDFEGAPEKLANFFGVYDTTGAEATPAYVNQ